MGKIIIGTAMLVAGLFISFIPPFFWGVPLFAVGVMTMMAGFASVTATAAKTTVSFARELSGSSSGTRSVNLGSAPAPGVSPALQKPAAKDYDEAKWLTLKEFNDAVQAAVKIVEPYGQAAEDRLAKAYLAVDDKSMLEIIATKIAADETEKKRLQEEKRAAYKAQMAESAQETFARTEATSRQMIEELTQNGMIMKYNGKKVVSAEMYYGDNSAFHGYARVLYADGSKELRSGQSCVFL